MLERGGTGEACSGTGNILSQSRTDRVIGSNLELVLHLNLYHVVQLQDHPDSVQQQDVQDEERFIFFFFFTGPP